MFSTMPRRMSIIFVDAIGSPPRRGTRRPCGMSRCVNFNGRSIRMRRRGNGERRAGTGHGGCRGLARAAYTAATTTDPARCPACSRRPRSRRLAARRRARRARRRCRTPAGRRPEGQHPGQRPPDPAEGQSSCPRGRDEIKKGLAELQATHQGHRQARPAAGRADLREGGAVGGRLQRGLRRRRAKSPRREREEGARGRPRTREGTEGRQDAVDDADRPRRSAATARRSTAACSRTGSSSRRTTTSPAKTKHRLDFWWHGRGETLSEANFMANPANAERHHPGPGRAHPPPLRPVLQREQVRRRDRHVRVPRPREEALPHRRVAARRPRVQHGRGRVLAVRASTTRRCGPRAPRGPGSARRPSS